MPTPLLRRPLSIFTVSPLTTRLPRSATAARRSTETGDRHHRRLRRLAAAHAAARPPVDGKETSTTADRTFSLLPALQRAHRSPETGDRTTADRTTHSAGSLRIWGMGVQQNSGELEPVPDGDAHVSVGLVED